MSITAAPSSVFDLAQQFIACYRGFMVDPGIPTGVSWAAVEDSFDHLLEVAQFQHRTDIGRAAIRLQSVRALRRRLTDSHPQDADLQGHPLHEERLRVIAAREAQEWKHLVFVIISTMPAPAVAA